MQVASKQSHWNFTGTGTEVELEMTPDTGLYIKFNVHGPADKITEWDWGDGSPKVTFMTHERQYLSHAYPTYGKYKIRCKNLVALGFRGLDGEPQYDYDRAIISYVDYAGTVTGSMSGAFKCATNLKRFVAPNISGMGQRDLANCSSLEEVVLGQCGIYYDGTFQNCPKLTKFTTGRSWTCWSYVWQGCMSLTELRLGDVNQFATQDFTNTPQLADIYIANKTIDQIKQVAASGNIVAGYGAKFPWGATATCRFHGTDGIVLGNGTIIR